MPKPARVVCHSRRTQFGSVPDHVAQRRQILEDFPRLWASIDVGGVPWPTSTG